MDYMNLLYIGVACVLVGLFAIYGLPALKELKINIDFNKLAKVLKGIALAIGDDDNDELTEKIYKILLNGKAYADSIEEDGILDFDKLLDFVVNQAEIMGVELGEVEMEILDIGCDIIASYIYNK